MSIQKDHRWTRAASLLGLVLATAAATGSTPEAQAPGGLVRQRSDKLPLVLGQAWLIADGEAPTPFPRIQSAVDAASDGDVIRLSDGLFRGIGNRDVTILGKNVRVESENGPDGCVIDCEWSGRGFLLEGDQVTSETVITGITVRRGVGLNLGGGGGFLVWMGSLATIENCMVLDCSSDLGGGIAYYADPGSLGLIRDCMISGCHASNQGGGVRGYNVLVERSTIVDNTARSMGAGLYLRQGSIARDCLIARNTMDCTCSNGGGGLLVRELVRVESCTIIDNRARFGGGIYTAFGPGVVVTNSILWGNRAIVPSNGDQVWSEFPAGAPDILLRYCDIEGGAAGVAGFPNPMIALVSILDVDPQLVDRAGGDYHLSASSPLIGAGDPDLVVQPFEGDLDGEPRANGPLDMGADERYAGLALSYPEPGRTGEWNEVRARGARPGARVFYFVGTGLGSTGLGFGACPTLMLELENPGFLDDAGASLTGEAAFGQHVPASMSGVAIALQAIGFDPQDPASGCARSNALTFVFP